MSGFGDIPPGTVFAAALHCGTAFLLVSAAIPKLRNPLAFTGVVANYRILPHALSTPFARLLPFVEIALAAGLLLPMTSGWAALASALLLLVFALAMEINIFRGRTAIDCGCRGDEMRQRLRPALVWRNIAWAFLLMISQFAAPLAYSSTMGIATFALALVAGGVFFLLYQVLERVWSIPALKRNRHAGG
ncbi:MAG TPA: MauE/DoxX family redox-associated membrane protein [Sphingomonadaceae bacterium]|nr:MauE/DoxX family redox-associated membrane protein [Sphingomonadaceae bacterium]